VPRNAVPHHSVEDRKQLPHARHQCHLLGLARLKQPLVELPDDGVVAGGEQGAHMYRAALTGALPPHTSRLPRKAPESRSNGATPTRAQSRLRGSVPSSGRARRGACGPRPVLLRGHAAEQFLVGAEGLAFPYRFVELPVYAAELLLQPPHVSGYMRFWPPLRRPSADGFSRRRSSPAAGAS
jgi:hypothetical protein